MAPQQGPGEGRLETERGVRNLLTGACMGQEPRLADTTDKATLGQKALNQETLQINFLSYQISEFYC